MCHCITGGIEVQERVQERVQTRTDVVCIYILQSLETKRRYEVSLTNPSYETSIRARCHLIDAQEHHFMDLKRRPAEASMEV